MIMKGLDFTTKQETSPSDGSKTFRPSSSTSWSRSKDPRVVRVSKFGGKDRHSKVFTVRGLRDRRVRLSVPTAIQLYDLQDRLGLSQPSKVIDWLLDVAKHEIDELPPLHIPPGLFSQNLQSMLTSLEVKPPQPDIEGLNIWRDDKDENWARRDGQGAFSLANNFFQRPNPSSLPGFLNNATSYNNTFLSRDPSDLSLSQSRSHGFTAQHDDLHNLNLVQPGSQVLLQHPGITQNYFPFLPDYDPKQVYFPTFGPSSQFKISLPPTIDTTSAQPIRLSPFSMMANALPSTISGASHLNRESNFDAC